MAIRWSCWTRQWTLSSSDPWLVEGLGYGGGAKGGQPPFDPVSMFKALILQAKHSLSDARVELMIRDRLSCMRFLGFELGAPTTDENAIRHFRNRMTNAGTMKRVIKTFDWQLGKKSYIPMSGQIVDASLVPAPKQRNTDDEKAAIIAGKSAKEIWPDKPNKAAQKNTNARWTLKIGGKVRHRPDGTPLPIIAVPVFGYKSHISIDRRFGFIRESTVTDVSAADGRQRPLLATADNTGSDVFADSAYRSVANERGLADGALGVSSRSVVVGSQHRKRGTHCGPNTPRERHDHARCPSGNTVIESFGRADRQTVRPERKDGA